MLAEMAKADDNKTRIAESLRHHDRRRSYHLLFLYHHPPLPIPGQRPSSLMVTLPALSPEPLPDLPLVILKSSLILEVILMSLRLLVVGSMVMVVLRGRR